MMTNSGAKEKPKLNPDAPDNCVVNGFAEEFSLDPD